MTSPVLLITFNRPAFVRRILNILSSVQPSSLYVFRDGPRSEQEREKCIEVTNTVTESVSWPCDLHTYYSDINLGCGLGPATAITWFFNNVEKGIILEDDCIPINDFFAFCDCLLNIYSNNQSVGFIGGCNYGYKSSNGASYSFCSGHHQTWGWATWKRTWDLFDYYLNDYDEKEFWQIIKKYYKSLRQREYWLNLFKKVKADQLNNSCWDYQFYFSLWKSDLLAICPNNNLVSNIGYGEDATHTQDKKNLLLLNPTRPIMPLKHPAQVAIDYHIDDFLMKQLIIPYQYGIEGLRRLPYRINRRIKRIIGHQGSWIKK